MKLTNRIYIFTILFALFISLLLIHGIKSSQSMTSPLTSSELKALDTTPFTISDDAKNQDRSKQQQEDLQAQRHKHNQAQLKLSQVMFPTEHSFDEKKKSKKTDPKDKKKKEAKKKDKDKDKDKKKEAKKDSDKTPDGQKPHYNANNEKSHFNGIENSQINEGTGSAYVDQTPPSRKDSNVPQTYEEWAQLLLGTPNSEKTQEFITLFSEKKISYDIFYKIVKEMTLDSRKEMKSLGLNALAATLSYQSFVFIADIMETRAQNDELRQDLQAEAHRYQNLNQIQIIKQVITTSESVFAVNLAIEELKLSAQMNLNAQATLNTGTQTTNSQGTVTGSTQGTEPNTTVAGGDSTSSTDGSGTSEGTSTVNTTSTTNATTLPNASIYQPFVSILNELMNDPSAVQLSDNLRNTLEVLHGFLG